MIYSYPPKSRTVPSRRAVVCRYIYFKKAKKLALKQG